MINRASLIYIAILLTADFFYEIWLLMVYYPGMGAMM